MVFHLLACSMASNDTAYILPQWLLPKGPGMKCRPHGTIIGMLAVYNIVSTIIAVITAGPFFYRQKQQVWSWSRKALSRLWPFRADQSNTEDPSFAEFKFWPFTISVLGSIVISLSAPLITGILITKTRPNTNRWVLIEQWSTRPRASLWIIWINSSMMYKSHWNEITEDDEPNLNSKRDGYWDTAIVTYITEFFVSFFGIKFLWDQTNVQSSEYYQSSTPCTTLGTSEGSPSNCPDMQTGANGLVLGTCVNGFVTLIFLLCLAGTSKNSKTTELLPLLFGGTVMTFTMYMYSWTIWSAFLNSASDDMYCIEASTPIDVIYCLLPVILGLWRLAWSTRGRCDSSRRQDSNAPS